MADLELTSSEVIQIIRNGYSWSWHITAIVGQTYSMYDPSWLQFQGRCFPSLLEQLPLTGRGSLHSIPLESWVANQSLSVFKSNSIICSFLQASYLHVACRDDMAQKKSCAHMTFKSFFDSLVWRRDLIVKKEWSPLPIWSQLPSKVPSCSAAGSRIQ